MEIIYFITWAILWYLILLSFGYIFLLAVSIQNVVRHFKELDIGNVVKLLKSNAMPPLTAFVAAYNEENNILETVYSLIRSDYTNIHIMIINDGSTDKTLEKLIKEFDLYKTVPIVPQRIKTIGKIKSYYLSKTHKNIIVIDKEHHDKSDSLNVALNACRTPLFLTIDADTLLVQPNALSYIVFSMLNKPHTLAVGGAIYILNGCVFEKGKIIEEKMSYNVVPALQICEYLRSFLFSRSGWNNFGGALCYAGAFTLFEYQAVLEVGGFDVGNVAQDFEIITHLQAYGYEHQSPCQVSYTPSASAWTDVPATLKSYWRQRTGWQKGSLRSLSLHKRMLFNPKYGVVGFYTYPFYLFGEILGPIVEFTAYSLIIINWLLGTLDIYWTILFIIICWGFVAFLTMATALMSFVTYNKYKRIRDLLWILVLIFIEQFGFRQYGVVCRVVATIRYIFNVK